MFNGASNLKLLVRAFRYRNYRLFFSGQAISLMGTWTQQVALSWLVYRLTGSTLLLGAVAFSSQIPTFFLSPYCRGDRRQIRPEETSIWASRRSRWFKPWCLAALVSHG